LKKIFVDVVCDSCLSELHRIVVNVDENAGIVNGAVGGGGGGGGMVCGPGPSGGHGLALELGDLALERLQAYLPVGQLLYLFLRMGRRKD